MIRRLTAEQESQVSAALARKRSLGVKATLVEVEAVRRALNDAWDVVEATGLPTGIAGHHRNYAAGLVDRSVNWLPVSQLDALRGATDAMELAVRLMLRKARAERVGR